MVAIVQDQREGWLLKSEFYLLANIVPHHWRLCPRNELCLEGEQVDQEQISLADLILDDHICEHFIINKVSFLKGS